MIALGDVAIIGGGCYGSFYCGQLERAREAGAVSYRRLLLIDRNRDCQIAQQPAAPGRELVVSDWDAFLDQWLGDPARDADGLADTIVPSPLMPHLLASWLERRAREAVPGRQVEIVPATSPLGTPYDLLHPSGVRYVSFADWICPTHCIEPALCPAIRAPRSWEMGDAVTAWTSGQAQLRRTAGPVLFTCRHAVFGVGMYPASLARDALVTLAEITDSPLAGDLVIGSVSACHGAVGVLRVGPA